MKTENDGKEKKKETINQTRRRPVFQLPPNLQPTSLRGDGNDERKREKQLENNQETTEAIEQTISTTKDSFMELISGKQEKEENIAEHDSAISDSNRSSKPHFTLRPIEVLPTTTEVSKPTFVLDFVERDTTERSESTTAKSPLKDDFFTTEQNIETTTTTRPTTTNSPKSPAAVITTSRSRALAENRFTPVTQTTTQRPPRPQQITEETAILNPVIYEYIYDYDYVDKGALAGSLGDLASLLKKAIVKSDGTIECLDTGYFPHPESCKMFISCSKTVRGFLKGWIYTCPQNLVFDPVGGMCNWTEEVDCIV